MRAHHTRYSVEQKLVKSVSLNYSRKTHDAQCKESSRGLELFQHGTGRSDNHRTKKQLFHFGYHQLASFIDGLCCVTNTCKCVMTLVRYNRYVVCVGV